MQYHVDGDLVPVADATVSVRNRGFMHGAAAFETLRRTAAVRSSGTHTPTGSGGRARRSTTASRTPPEG